MSSSGWIGVDLDGTLAEYHGWTGGAIGPPIPLMLERVKKWLADGVEVRIFTARIAPHPGVLLPNQAMAVLPAAHSELAFRAACEIAVWCREHFGRVLPITCMKDYSMIELWDDRAIQVEANTGRRMDGLE